MYTMLFIHLVEKEQQPWIRKCRKENVKEFMVRGKNDTLGAKEATSRTVNLKEMAAGNVLNHFVICSFVHTRLA